MQNRLAQCPHLVTEHQRDISAVEVTPLRCSQPKTGLPRREEQGQKEESSQYLAVKSSGNSIQPGETKGYWKLRHSLKGLVYSLSCSQVLNLGSSRWTAVGEAPKTFRKRISCVASGQGLEEQPALSL